MSMILVMAIWAAMAQPRSIRRTLINLLPKAYDLQMATVHLRRVHPAAMHWWLGCIRGVKVAPVCCPATLRSSSPLIKWLYQNSFNKQAIKQAWSANGTWGWERPLPKTGTETWSQALTKSASTIHLFFPQRQTVFQLSSLKIIGWSR